LEVATILFSIMPLTLAKVLSLFHLTTGKVKLYILFHLIFMFFRLGLLGWLSHSVLSSVHPEAPTNFGFQDQVLALNWISNNIAVFGGSPEKITLMGDDAGATSLLLHLMRGEVDVQRAIILSPYITTMRELAVAEKKGEEWANDIGCGNNSRVKEPTPDLVRYCLRFYSVEGFLNQLSRVFPLTHSSKSNIIYPVRDEKFISSQILPFFKNGKMKKKMSVIFGNTMMEGNHHVTGDRAFPYLPPSQDYISQSIQKYFPTKAKRVFTHAKNSPAGRISFESSKFSPFSFFLSFNL